MPKKTALLTDFVTLGTMGQTVDGREIQEAWLTQMAETYDCAEYTAVINSEHFLGYFGSFGQVRELRTEKDGKGRTVLQGRLEPNERLLMINSMGQHMFLSMEVDTNFCDSGKAYLVGLALTDSPASVGTTELRFKKCAENKQFVGASVEVDAAAFRVQEDETPTDGKSFKQFLTDLFKHKEDGDMKEELQKLLAAQEAQTKAIAELTALLAKKPGDESNAAKDAAAAAAEAEKLKKGTPKDEPADKPGEYADTLKALADGQAATTKAVTDLTATLTKALAEGKGTEFKKPGGAAGGGETDVIQTGNRACSGEPQEQRSRASEAHTMRNQTRTLYRQMLADMARTYGVQNTHETFAVSDLIETRLNDAIQDSIDFLGEISQLPVTDMKGQALAIQIPSTVASRTNTAAGNTRTPQQAGSPDGLQYECKKTDFDVAIPYSVLDAWARFPDFRQRYMNAIYRRIALDRILIGWNGTSAADATDRDANPDLSDVNLGWLYQLATNAPAQWMTEGVADSDRINLCADGDFENLDQLVFSVFSMIGKAHRTGREVAIIGQELVTTDMGKVLATHGQTPTERAAMKQLDKSYGGVPSMTVPGFPDRGILVTDPKNLHLYWQASAMRRHTKEEPERDQVADYISSNEAYFFGDFDGAAGILGDNVYFELPAEGQPERDRGQGVIPPG